VTSVYISTFHVEMVQGYGKLWVGIDLMSDYLWHSQINLISRRNCNTSLKTPLKCTLEAVFKSI
jgi:hypothetical protein